MVQSSRRVPAARSTTGRFGSPAPASLTAHASRCAWHPAPRSLVSWTTGVLKDFPPDVVCCAACLQRILTTSLGSMLCQLLTYLEITRRSTRVNITTAAKYAHQQPSRSLGSDKPLRFLSQPMIFRESYKTTSFGAYSTRNMQCPPHLPRIAPEALPASWLSCPSCDESARSSLQAKSCGVRVLIASLVGARQPRFPYSFRSDITLHIHFAAARIDFFLCLLRML